MRKNILSWNEGCSKEKKNDEIGQSIRVDRHWERVRQKKNWVEFIRGDIKECRVNNKSIWSHLHEVKANIKKRKNRQCIIMTEYSQITSY